MKASAWVDHGVTLPTPLPDDTEAALVYLTHTLGHVCFERWTLTRLKRNFASLGDANAAKSAVFRLLLDHPEAIEWWEQGRVRTAPLAEAPAADAVLAKLLQTHRRRFKALGTSLPVVSESPDWLAVIAPRRNDALLMWLGRTGRFVNANPDTNILATTVDTQALSLFLRDRASRSRHTLRAYASELRRLIAWCQDQQRGPLSDLTRKDLLGYRDALRTPQAEISSTGRPGKTHSDSSQPVQYWFDTGYLVANPAAGLVSGFQERTQFAPKRFLPAPILEAADAWLARRTASVAVDDVALARRRAIWALHRYAGIRLAESAWSAETGLPCVEAESTQQWTLYVCGKGNKLRVIPLPSACIAPLRRYRQARGLPPAPGAHEVLPLIHGFKGGALQESGLYDEVKAIFGIIASDVGAADPSQTLLLQVVSPHWLRHAYAKALIVDHQVPLPVALALLGHASIHTTAAYAKTDLSQLRSFVEAGFARKPRTGADPY